MYKFAVASFLVFSAMGSATAQDWPQRPVTMIVPFAAGSGTDILGRIIGSRLSEVLGQQVVIEDMGGAGGMNGSSRTAKAAPDGYTFVLGNVGTHAQNQTLYKSPLYSAMTDFEPVGLVADLPPVLITRPDMPANNLKEFAAYAKLQQDKIRYGSAGTGSAAQLGCALLNSDLGLTSTHVPYRGAAPAMQDLIASRIDYQCALLPAPLSQIAAKQVKAIAILTKARSPALADLPTADEQGMAGFDASAWHAVFLPKNTPQAIVKKLNEALAVTLDTPAIRTRMLELGVVEITPDRRSSDYLAKFVASEIKKWGTIIEKSGLTPM